MARYFLNIRDGDEYVEDAVGAEYPDLTAALAAAVEGARDILAEMVKFGEELNGQQVEICDEAGKIVGTVRFRDTFNVPSYRRARS